MSTKVSSLNTFRTQHTNTPNIYTNTWTTKNDGIAEEIQPTITFIKRWKVHGGLTRSIKMKYHALWWLAFSAMLQCCSGLYDNGFNTLDNAQYISGVRASGLRSITDRSCPENTVTDVALGSCVRFACPPNYEVNRFKCVPKTTSSNSQPAKRQMLKASPRSLTPDPANKCRSLLRKYTGSSSRVLKWNGGTYLPLPYMRISGKREWNLTEDVWYSQWT